MFSGPTKETQNIFNVLVLQHFILSQVKSHVAFKNRAVLKQYLLLPIILYS